MALCQPIFFVFKPDFDHGMLACHDMFDMFSLTCLSCDMGAWHFYYRGTFIIQQDMAHTGTLERRVWQVARLVANALWRCDIIRRVTAQ